MKCDKCGYDWEYKGKSKYYISCPRCRANIPVNPKKSTAPINNREIETNIRKDSEENIRKENNKEGDVDLF